jgi:hypothetical protein
VDPVIAVIDPSDASVIGTPQVMEESPGGNQEGMDGIAVRPTDGIIFGTEADSGTLYTINPTNGLLTLIGQDDSESGLASLTFGPAQGRTAAPVLSQLGLGALLVSLLAGGSLLLRRRSHRV